MTTTATIFHGLYQAEYGVEDDATLVAVFSDAERAEEFAELLSDQHTALKLEVSDLRDRRIAVDAVPDLYWDVRPVAFDPRTVGELL